MAPKGKGMQLGKKSKATDTFERLGIPEETAPLVTAQSSAPAPAAESPARTSVSGDGIRVSINESISAKLSREGTLKSLSVNGDLKLRITDPSLTKVKLDITANATHGAQFKPHPNLDKNLFSSHRTVQLKDTSRGFPVNNSVAVVRWTASPKDSDALPITFTAWLNKGTDESYNITVEYELTGQDALKDVNVTIPYATSEPAVSSFDAVYQVNGDSLEWNIGPVDSDNPSGSFEFEAQADDEGEFFPMQVRFSKTSPFVDVDVSPLGIIRVTLLTCPRSPLSHS